jgi:hypothetical protein
VDTAKEFRFLIPSFFLFASLMWGAALGNKLEDVKLALASDPSLTSVIVATIGAAGLTLPVGFLLESISSIVCRWASWRFARKHLQACLSDACLGRLHAITGTDQRSGADLYVATVFVHDVVRSRRTGAFEWLTRRWTGFNAAASSSVGVLLAYPIGRFLGIPGTWRWIGTTALFALALAYYAYRLFTENREMIDFLSTLSWPEQTTTTSTPNAAAARHAALG